MYTRALKVIFGILKAVPISILSFIPSKSPAFPNNHHEKAIPPAREPVFPRFESSVASFASNVYNAWILFNSGRSFTLTTVSTNVSCPCKLPSLTVRVTVVVQNSFADGFILTVQFGAVPQIVMFAVGNNVVLLLVFITLLAHVNALSTSLIVNATLFFGASSFVL